jgi:hypothetical protein
MPWSKSGNFRVANDHTLLRVDDEQAQRWYMAALDNLVRVGMRQAR